MTEPAATLGIARPLSGEIISSESADLDADTFQKLRGLFTADQREDIIILDSRGLSGRLRVAFARVHQNDFVGCDLLDRLAEEGSDAALVHAFIDHHLVAELQVAFEIAANDERDGVVAPADQLGPLFRTVRGQINRGFDGRIPRPDDHNVLARILVGVGQLIFHPLVFVGAGRLRNVLEAALLAEFVIGGALRAAFVAELWQDHFCGGDDHLQILARNIHLHRRAAIADGQDHAARAVFDALLRLILIGYDNEDIAVPLYVLATFEFVDDHAVGPHRLHPGADHLLLDRAPAVEFYSAFDRLINGVEIDVLARLISLLDRRDDLILLDGDVFQSALGGERRGRQPAGADADDRHVIIGFPVPSHLLDVFNDVINHRAAFVDRVLDQRHARNVSDQVDARDVGHKTPITFGHFAFGNLLDRVDDDAGFRNRRTFDLAAGVLHALFDGHQSGFAVDYRQHVVRAGVDTGVAADAGGDVDDRVRISQSFGIENGQREFSPLGFLFDRRRFGPPHLFDHATATAPRVRDDQGEPDEENKEKEPQPAGGRHRAVTNLQFAGKSD